MALENPLVKKVSIPVILARGTIALFLVFLALAAVSLLQYREITRASHHGAVASDAGEALIIMTNELEQLTARNGSQALTRLRQIGRAHV
jgi:hypothetical protein